MDSARLSQPRHCTKGVQPVLKALYCSICRDKYNCCGEPRYAQPQSVMLPLYHH